MSVVINSYQRGRPSKVDVATAIEHLRFIPETADLNGPHRSEPSRTSSLPHGGDGGATGEQLRRFAGTNGAPDATP
jgi:hypothetical protein